MPTPLMGRTTIVRDQLGLKREVYHPEPLKTVLYADTFDESPVKWTAWGGGSIGRNTTYAFRGSASLGITTAAALGNWTEALRMQAPPRAGRKIGLSLMWAGPATNFDYFGFGIEMRDLLNTQWHRGVILIYPGVRPYYRASDGVWTQFGAATGLPDHYDVLDFASGICWHYCKLVCDLSSNVWEYREFICDDVRVDMSGTGLYDVVAGGEGNPNQYNMVEYYVGFATSADAAITGLVDDVLLTLES